MGHHPGQGVLQVFRQQGVEVVGVEFVASGHGHQARRGAQPHRRRQGDATGTAEPAEPDIQEILLGTVRAEAPLNEGGG